jgi:hypothetical protein
MWRDRERYPEQNYVPDTFWLVVAALLFAACGLVWLIGQVAALLVGAHQHLPVRLVDMLGVLLRLPGTWNDPARAWPPSAQPLLPGPGRHVRRRHPHLLAPRPGLWATGPAAVPPGPPTPPGTRRQVGKLVATPPAARAGPKTRADHPGAPRPPPRPPPRPAVSGRRAVPLGAGLRPTRLLQDPRAGHPGHPGVAGQPGHHLHQTRCAAGHLRPPGQPGGRLGLRPPRAEWRAGSSVVALGPLPDLRRRPTDRADAGRRRRHRRPPG